MRALRFLSWPALCGLLIALLVLEQLPEHSDEPAGASRTTEAPPAAANNSHYVTSYADAVSLASPAVVNIYTTKVVRQQLHPLLDDAFLNRYFSRGNPFQRERVQRSLGSGVIMTREGHLLTNHHVVEDAREIIVLLHDGRETLARVIGTDPETDLAALQINLPGVTPIEVGSPRQSRVGDVVLAIGNPYGFGHSVSQGIISATGRYGLFDDIYENFIQTDAAINPGSSGGALINAEGKLLGINTVIYTQSGGSTGIGLAIPADVAVRTLQDLIEYGRPVRGWLGIEVRPLTHDQLARNGTAPGNGVIVTGIYRDGPAARAGLMPGDILLRINGQPVGDGNAGMNLIGFSRPGDEVALEISRNGKTLELFATVEARPEIES